MEIALLALPRSYASGLATCRDAFALIRGQVEAVHAERDLLGMATRVRVVSQDGRDVLSSDGARVAIDAGLARDRPFALIHIPPFELPAGAIDSFLADQALTIDWLARQHAAGALVAASGSAIFLLAEAGLLAVDPMWPPRSLGEAFRDRYPRLKGAARGSVLDQGRVFIARGLAAQFELMVRLTERVISAQMSGWLARAVGLDQLGSDDLADDPLVADAQVWLGARYNVAPRIAELAASLGVSHQTLIRRFRDALGTTPRHYVQHLRIVSARLQLEHTARPVAQIATLVGYDDLKSFRTVFRALTGMSALRYRAERRSSASR